MKARNAEIQEEMFSKCSHSNLGDKTRCAQVAAGNSSCYSMLGCWLSPNIERYALGLGVDKSKM